jgi:hypothetical protein
MVDDENDLAYMVQFYFEQRGVKLPTFEQAMMFLHVELGDVYEIYLAQSDGWRRNHSIDGETEFSKRRLAEELGDAIMMLVVAGLVCETDPIQALLENLARKSRVVSQ